MSFSTTLRITGIALLATTTFSGCAALNTSKERGGAIGAAAGAAVGGAIGNNNGGTARGAIIGAAVGGAIGAVIGHQMDQQAKKLEQNIPGARIERVGEGIQVTFESGLLFETNSATVSTAARENLRNLANSLSEYPNTELVIVGHTDSRGEDAHNQTLSEQRSRATAAYLVSQGVPVSRIRTVGRGEAEPVATNDTDAGRAQNRRVEVAIFASEAYREQLRRQPR